MKRIKITQTRLKQLVENIVNEMDTDTYANIMNKTEKFPWSQYLSGTQFLKGDEKKRSVPHKEERVNKLAKERFTENFYKEFPRKSESTNILTSNGEYYFGGIKFNTNYTNYGVFFVKNGDDFFQSYLWIKPERNGYHIDTNGIEITDEDSDKLINDMLKYNLMKK